jgi:O-acetyl-ADP-ribose deacetylase (regulator of RNase III)
MSLETTTLYRPVGPKELALIAASGYREFPPRLPQQPIFYPVLNEEYARQIARDWNVKDSGAGYVTRFAVRKEFLAKYSTQKVGSEIHQELWIPADALPDMNRNIVGLIEVIAEFKADVEDSAPSRATWILKHKNILDEPADVLVCSANVNLLLSGGVGADLLARYGNAMQEALLERLQARKLRCAQRGEIFPYSGPEMPYRAVLHAVAINGWYESSPEVITEIVRRTLKMAAETEAKKVALTALATGFGRLTFAEFALGIKPLLLEPFSPVNEVVICLLLDFQVAELARQLPEIQTEQDRK